MKKIILVIIIMALAAVAGACGGGKGEEVKDWDLEEVMAAVTNDVADLPMSETSEISEEKFGSYLFIDYIEGAEGLSSDSLIGSIPHSVCLLKLPEGADAQKTAEEIEKNADPRKWICVESEKVIVKREGNLILLVMSFEGVADAVAANFEEAVK